MNTSALIMYLVANITVISFTTFFFLKVLRTPPKDHDVDDEGYPEAHGPKTFDMT